MPTLHLGILRIPRRARLQLVRRLLVRGIQRPAHFPTQAAALTGLVLGVLARHFVEFGAVAEFGQGFFFLGVLLALDCRLALVLSDVRVESMYQDVTSVDCRCGFQLRGSARLVVFAGGGAFAFVFGLVATFGCWFLARCHGEVICKLLHIAASSFDDR